eukprot:TRINITY_DN11831_c0_g1_i12.p3 TRINITY_DN11831_c0_g1~~TRINITY_DN11831_c0_g1_i12.p3  ORF type:complete len:133 (-),score=5.76 TRINITY_DN11831_c0_g1_i12:1974-2372(-)
MYWFLRYSSTFPDTAQSEQRHQQCHNTTLQDTRCIVLLPSNQLYPRMFPLDRAVAVLNLRDRRNLPGKRHRLHPVELLSWNFQGNNTLPNTGQKAESSRQWHNRCLAHSSCTDQRTQVARCERTFQRDKGTA